MRQIYEIKKLTGGRYLVTFLDGAFFPLYGKELDEFGIHEDGELSETAYTRILQEILPKRARLCAMHFLEHQDRTEHQLRKKLVDLYYPEEIVEDAAAYVKNYHYIDDVRYAVNYIEYRKDTKSMRQLEQELSQKGISREDIQTAREQIELPDEEHQIMQWLQKKHYHAQDADRKETDRIYRFLLRKGYSASAISRVMRLEEW
jgi:regulatory protein